MTTIAPIRRAAPTVLAVVLLTAALAAADVVAVVNGQEISSEELDRWVAPQLEELEGADADRVYRVRREGLDNLVLRTLLEQRARQEGTTAAELYRREVTETAASAADGDREAPILRERFRQALLADARVDDRLSPPRSELTVDADDPALGPADAPVTVIEFADFQCPFCKRVTPTLTTLQEEYGDRVRWVFKQLPLDIHPDARTAAEASLCAAEQDRFWQLHDWMFEHQRSLDAASLKEAASELGLDAAEFSACLDERRHTDEVVADIRQAKAIGAQGTPTFVINGEVVKGVHPPETFREIIDRHLATSK